MSMYIKPQKMQFPSYTEEELLQETATGFSPAMCEESEKVDQIAAFDLCRRRSEDGCFEYLPSHTFLIDQKYCEDMSQYARSQFSSMLAPRTSNYLQGNYTDDQLLMHVKSRHIQEPCDVEDWMDHIVDCDNAIDAEISDAKREALANEKKAQQEAAMSKFVQSTIQKGGE